MRKILAIIAAGLMFAAACSTDGGIVEVSEEAPAAVETEQVEIEQRESPVVEEAEPTVVVEEVTPTPEPTPRPTPKPLSLSEKSLLNNLERDLDALLLGQVRFVTDMENLRSHRYFPLDIYTDMRSFTEYIIQRLSGPNNLLEDIKRNPDWRWIRVRSEVNQRVVNSFTFSDLITFFEEDEWHCDSGGNLEWLYDVRVLRVSVELEQFCRSLPALVSIINDVRDSAQALVELDS